MTKPRTQLVSLTETPYYHIVSRCVRRAFLCGYDRETNSNYDHRKQWIVDRLQLLSSVFSINLCSYAIMSNHYHLVVHIEPEQSNNWSNKDVAQRWTTIFQGPLLVQQWLDGAPLSQPQQKTVDDIINIWRKRLSNLSWFMKCLNEPLARQANKEDRCTGHFWESRYKSQALKTDQALLTCMAYVDLNPIRAKQALTPEDSDYTSIQERVKPVWDLKKAIQRQIKQRTLPAAAESGTSNLAHSKLMPFKGKEPYQQHAHLPFSFIDYLELVDWTGRIVREDKRGYIKQTLPPIIQRLAINRKNWILNSNQFEQIFNKQFNQRRLKENTS